MGSFSKGKMVSFHQISKMGENIKVDICKCPINVKLFKKSSQRPGTLQMPFQIHLHLCAVVLFKFIVGSTLTNCQALIWVSKTFLNTICINHSYMGKLFEEYLYVLALGILYWQTSTYISRTVWGLCFVWLRGFWIIVYTKIY